jgi:LPPG:FO 2-phospho-L-lactate transferase
MKVVALAGGVGGAKLADGLAQLSQVAANLTVIVNTGDDFDHCGLRICPDLDTVSYTLGGLANLETGWGRSNETWHAFGNLKALSGPDWFRLGDQDLGTHLERTRRLLGGERLSAITHDFCRTWGIVPSVLPMSDDIVSTWIEAERLGWISFQEYFVKHACQPKMIGFKFMGVEEARPAPGVLEAIDEADIIIVCPSNPFVSIGPILAVREISAALRGKPVVVAVSPIVGGKAIKGPAAKMFTEFNRAPSPLAVAEEYRDWVTGLMIDNQDIAQSELIAQLGMAVRSQDTIMRDRQGRKQLAELVLEFGEELGRKGRAR